MDCTIRTASPADAASLLKIYGRYVRDTAITFEYDVPSEEEFAGRIENTLRRYPYLIAEDADGRILGYAYAGAFHPRAAYDWCAEMTIYLDPDCRRAGLGRKLYAALEDGLKAMGVCNIYACIAYPRKDDEYLTKNSAEFHAHLGYALAGIFHDCGYKFGRWYDMIWMEKIIGEHTDPQPPVKKYPGIE